MQMATHEYATLVRWTGNRGAGTKDFRAYERTWDIAVPGKPVIPCSNDPLKGGDESLMNPEDLLLSALSACHMLWYLRLASQNGVVVQSYQDEPVAIGEDLPNGAGRFLSAELRPKIVVSEGCDLARARALHDEIHQYCFIARSVSFPISYAPVFETRRQA